VELINTLGSLERAKRWALSNFDKWIEVTGFMEQNCSYYYEISAIIEDAVEFGFGVAHNQKLKTILKRIRTNKGG
jgi:hypothetical protein